MTLAPPLPLHPPAYQRRLGPPPNSVSTHVVSLVVAAECVCRLHPARVSPSYADALVVGVKSPQQNKTWHMARVAFGVTATGNMMNALFAVALPGTKVARWYKSSSRSYSTPSVVSVPPPSNPLFATGC